jgi:hypothetical protein
MTTVATKRTKSKPTAMRSSVGCYTSGVPQGGAFQKLGNAMAITIAVIAGTRGPNVGTGKISV